MADPNQFWESDDTTNGIPVASMDADYWKGHLVDVDDTYASGIRIESGAARYGSVSARARQLYAVEALRNKDHITAGLLAIFLGIFGIHKFYLGCNQAAFVMLAITVIGGLVTFGLAVTVVAVIAAIEGIIYLSKNQTEFNHIYVVNQRDWF